MNQVANQGKQRRGWDRRIVQTHEGEVLGDRA